MAEQATEQTKRQKAEHVGENPWQYDVHLMRPQDWADLQAQHINLPLANHELRQYLPHRYPMLLVDKVTACAPFADRTVNDALVIAQQDLVKRDPESTKPAPLAATEQLPHQQSPWITGYKNISHNEPFFMGHFPDQPIMPGVLIVEAMAQLAGVMAFIRAGQTAFAGEMFLFAGIDKVRFKRSVVPGDMLVMRAQLLQEKHSLYRFEAKAFVEFEMVACAQILLSKQPTP